MAALEGKHVPLAELAPDAPPRLTAIIESLLIPDRRQRPSSAAMLVEMLDELAPPPRVRRELGAMAANATAAEAERVDTGVKRTGASGAEVEELGVGEAATLPARPVGEQERPATPAPTRLSRRDLGKRAGWAVLALGGATAGVFALWPDRTTDPTERPLLAPRPGTEDKTEDNAVRLTAEPARDEPPEDVELNRTEATDAEARPEPAPTPAPAPRALLTVAVFPWGDVWINGKPRGTAPLKNYALKPGVHKISAGQGSPSKTQSVRLRSGQHKTVVFDLTATD
jgi:hypothetical protein